MTKKVAPPKPPKPLKPAATPSRKTKPAAPLERTADALAAQTPQEIEQMLHELRVHQIELEMQNEELRTAQALIEAARAHYFDLYDMAPLGYCTLSEQGLILEVNLTAVRLLGTTRSALLKQPFSRFILKEDQDRYYLHCKQLLATDEAQACELRLARPDGALFWAHVTAIAVPADDGAPVVRVTFSDVSERMRAEQDFRRSGDLLRESEARLTSLLDETKVHLWIFDGSSYKFFNKQWYDFTGQSPADGKTIETWTSAVHPDDLPKATEIWLQHWATKTEHDNYFRLRRHDGVYRDFFCHALPLFDEYGVFQAFQGFNLDITERKQAEDALRASEDKFRSIFSSMTEMVVLHELVCDADGRPANYRILDCNPAFTQITGIRRDDAVGRLATDVYGSDTAPYLDEYARVALTGEPCTFITSYAPMDKHFDIHAASPGTNRFVTVTTDISERKRAEAALQASENRFRNLLENIPTVAVQGYDENGITRYWNHASERLYGYPADEAIGRSLFDLIIPAELHDGVREAIREMFETAVPITAGELPLRRKDGSRVDVFSSHAFVHLPGRSPEMFCVDIDISERKRTEVALRRGEERIRNMSDAAGAYLWEIDTNMVYTYVSGQAMLVKGHQPEALLGHTPMDFMLSEDIAPVAEIVNRAIAEKSPFRLQHRDITPSGEVWWEEVYGAVFCDAEGKVIGLRGTGMGINASKQAENALRHEKQFTVDTLNALPGVFYMFDATGRFVRWNHQFSKVTGYTDTELATMQATDFFAGDDQRRVYEAVQRVFDEGLADIEADFQTKDGQKLPYRFTGQSSTIGEQTYLLGVGIDVSEQRRVQQALEIERTHLHTLVRTIPDLIWLKDADGIYLACNPEFERFFGAAERDILGKTDYDFVSKDQADLFREHDLATIAAGEATCNEEWITYASDGRRILLETTKTPMRTPEGRLVGILGVGHDITERNAHQQQLEHIAHFDNLTGLPNRVLLADRLHQAMTQTLRRKTMLAVTFLDLDGFKAINDNYGHEAGDYLLTTLSGHMKRALREGDTLARIGGDEFVAILLDLPDIESSLPMISRLLAAATEVADFEGNTLRVSASLGVTFYPQAEAIDADQLMRQADQAMYKAKQSGKNRYHIFDTEHDRSVRNHHESLDRIKKALDQREFVLYYQPKVNMRTGVVIGTEALIRWQHPEHGLLAPAAFLPSIADHPLAIEIGEWVLDTAMAQIETWKAAGLPLPVSVNIDAIHLAQTDFVDHLRQHLLAHPALSAGDLELEVLETSALHDIAYVSSVILACREMGVGFALDDFGTGYSSLTYLKHLPASLLKIDQSFVRDMLNDPDDLSILNGVLGLSIAFRRQAIAEGVETLEHGEILLQLGCELAQGYVIARPMAAEDMPVWLAAWRPDPTWLNRAPISRDDLPILIAWVEHRAWILKVEKVIRGVGDTLPPMNHEKCRVGQWLNDEVRLPNENHLAIEALGPLHIQIHELASELIRLKQDSQMEVAITRLPELYRLRDCLLAKFMAILR